MIVNHFREFKQLAIDLPGSRFAKGHEGIEVVGSFFSNDHSEQGEDKAMKLGLSDRDGDVG